MWRTLFSILAGVSLTACTASYLVDGAKAGIDPIALRCALEPTESNETCKIMKVRAGHVEPQKVLEKVLAETK
jgi:hypothetical protein